MFFYKKAKGDLCCVKLPVDLPSDAAVCLVGKGFQDY